MVTRTDKKYINTVLKVSCSAGYDNCANKFDALLCCAGGESYWWLVGNCCPWQQL